jgi:hypothetical protein
LGVFDPSLLAVRVATNSRSFFEERAIDSHQAGVDLLELGFVLDLDTEVLYPYRRASGADRKIHARILEHPFRIVGLPHDRCCGEKLRIETNGML